jgi:hypothetical protein
VQKVDGAEVWIDDAGKAYRADSSRAPQYDVKMGEPISRAFALGVLAGVWSRINHQGGWLPGKIASLNAVEEVAEALNLKEELQAALQSLCETRKK